MLMDGRRRERLERGVVAVIVAVSATALLIAGAIVLDFGLVRYERQTNKSATDSAVAAGLRAGDAGTGEFYHYRAVCEAVRYLRASRTALAGLPDGACATENSSLTCTAGDPSVTYHESTTFGAKRFEVWVKSPYVLTDATAGGSFPEESSVSTLSSDPGDNLQQGCDQLGVVIKEWTTPGLGKLVSSNEIMTRTRTVGRVKLTTGDAPPALLLLERTKCGVLTVGSAGSPSRISVAGSGTTAATIHSDSSATDGACGSGSNQQLLQGKQADGVVAFGGSSGTPGTITTVATLNGVASNVVSDSSVNVYGSTSTYPTTGTPLPITGRSLVTRRPVDKRYLSGVTTAAQGAYTEWNRDHVTPGGGYTRFGCPSAADMTAMAAMTASQAVYIDCPGSGIGLTGAIGAGTIYFHGFIKGGNLSMPNATQIYIDDSKDSGAADSSTAISLSNNTAFCVRATACATGTPLVGQCSTNPTLSATSKARLTIRRGTMSGTGTSSLLRLCNTTVLMEGGDLGANTSANPGGCLPTSWGSAPTTTPCQGTSAGDSPIQYGGVADWTAPNAYGDMTAAGLTAAQKQSMWDGGEDLALWTETYGSGSDFKMAGGGNLHVAGVFMVPNAAPFTVTGSGTQDLSNAQYVVRSFAVDGGATLKMSVDPYNAVGLPSLNNFSLVR